MIPLTPAHSAAHVLPGDAGVGASEVGLVTDKLAILVRVVTSRSGGGVYTWSGHRLSHTFTADSYIPISRGLSGAVPPGWEAAVLVSVPGIECLISALTGSHPPDALVSTSYIVASVFTDVAALGVRQLGPRRDQDHKEKDHRPQTHCVTWCLCNN